jgi:hypothetical protein
MAERLWRNCGGAPVRKFQPGPSALATGDVTLPGAVDACGVAGRSA